MDSTAFLVIALIAITAQSFLIFVALFGPGHRYHIRKAAVFDLESEDYVRMLEALADAKIYENNSVEVLTNGENFYEAELAAIRNARRSINLEAYIFQRGAVSARFIKAMAERARAGVRVNVVLDSIGSFASTRGYFRELLDAGGCLEYYHPVKWYTWPRINNRTHRELLIVDGETGFVGGAGVADHWLKGTKKHPRWRDTMCRVTGDAVIGLQSTFVENWLESSGEILSGKEYFPFCNAEGTTRALVVNSTPSAGYSTRSRVLFQTLLASARKSIHITTPYFLPDRGAREELIRAIRERRVQVRVIVPGKHHDHPLTRRSSRRIFGDLLRAGVKIYEYRASMLHHKCLLVDGKWSVVGTTNFDNRSFGLNDEVNLAALDQELFARLLDDFETDVAQSEPITYENWCKRSLFERCHEWLGWFLERQQ
jgi:cardiolipin synthase